MESGDDSSSLSSTDYSTDSSSSSTNFPTDDIVDDPEIFKCDLCNKVFSHVSTLRRHKKDHEASKCRGLNNEEYICHLCNKLYYFVRHYNAHMLKHHNVSIDVSSTNSLETNCHNHSSEENTPDESIKRIDETRSLFFCNHCDRQFYSKHDVTFHLKTHLVQSYRCKVCHKRFSSQDALSRHENNEKNKAHRLMKKKRRSKKQLQQNRILLANIVEQELSHKSMNEKQVSSGEPSSRKEQLLPNAVMKADTEEPVNTCTLPNECASFIDQVLPNEQIPPDNLVPTKQLVSEEAVSPEVQLSDQISDLNSSVLENNQGQSSSIETIDLDPVEVSDTKNFSCTICDRKFFTENTLQLHLATHRKLPQMHYCSLCDYCSECQFAFALHALDHYKKKFKCNSCNRSFYTKHTLEFHAETHLSSINLNFSVTE